MVVRIYDYGGPMGYNYARYRGPYLPAYNSGTTVINNWNFAGPRWHGGFNNFYCAPTYYRGGGNLWAGAFVGGVLGGALGFGLGALFSRG
jgi:hypothetical protein